MVPDSIQVVVELDIADIVVDIEVVEDIAHFEEVHYKVFLQVFNLEQHFLHS